VLPVRGYVVRSGPEAVRTLPLSPALSPAYREEGGRLARWMTVIVCLMASIASAAPTTAPAGKSERVSFKNDVMPIFMRAGCNAGACHGSARGQDGFHLSLFGYDPDGDYRAITRELATRRINLAQPEQSLLLTKTVGDAPHTGGKRFEKDSVYYQTLLRWLEQGAQPDPKDTPEPVSLEILPKQALLQTGDAPQPFTARAKYSDGSERDVTNLARFLSNNDNSAKIADTGIVTPNNRGEAFVMARFATFTVGAQVIVVPKGQTFEWPANLPENNYVDALVNAKLKKLHVLPSELCDDETFLRRVHLDIVGQLPTPEEHAAFLASTDPKKREQLVDQLLGRKEFVEMWVMRFAELLKIRSVDNVVSYKSAVLYYNWLQKQLEDDVPIDKVVRALLAADGGTFKNPATNYYQVETDTLKLAENTAQVFMGMRIQCAQCHNHPFDRWTMNDYYGFASFFTQVGRKPGEDQRELIVFNSGGGEVNQPVAKKPIPPKFLGGEAPNVSGKDRRQVLADWLASPQNPYFARNLSNVIWQHFLGVGIIDPVDDVRISNPASNPELLDELARKFTEYNFDFKKLVRDICLSRTYQLSTRPNSTNATDTRNFAKATIRRTRAEVLLDCISQVTEAKEKFRGLPLGARAVQIADGATTNYFLRTFGRASRETVCSCEVKMEPNLSQALHLLNGKTTAEKVEAGGVVKRLLDQKKTPEQVIEALYVRCLTRMPTPEEIAGVTAQLKDEKDPSAVLNDLFWALLNSQEFMFAH
jgi:hypothetical protein